MLTTSRFEQQSAIVDPEDMLTREEFQPDDESRGLSRSVTRFTLSVANVRKRDGRIALYGHTEHDTIPARAPNWGIAR
jgi:hypothetical protein